MQSLMQKQRSAALRRSSTGKAALPSAAKLRMPMVRPALATDEKSALEKFSASIGLPMDDGIGGFTPFAEMWVGRWAQIGFASSIVGEFVSGKGTLGQLGLTDGTPSTPVLAALCLLMGGATLVGSAITLKKLITKTMTKTEINGYRTFLALNNNDDYKEEAASMKRKGDFTTIGLDEAAIAKTKAAAEAPADAFLSTTNDASAPSTPSVASTSAPAASTPMSAQQRQSSVEQLYFGETSELAYARGIEITNGRYAMIGFAAAILVEAATGDGILKQVIDICKWSGLLGERSGF